jgi:antitoxin (DNA-binding transcriptional repressor) of toxin-antitoxin stability system
MKIVTLSQARTRLPALVERARRGEDIGIIAGDQIVALRPVPIVSADIQSLTAEYVGREYGVTGEALARFTRRQSRANASARRRGEVVTFRGRFDPMVLG